jgi:hypothetical protein
MDLQIAEKSRIVIGFITILLAGIRFNAIEIEPSGY